MTNSAPTAPRWPGARVVVGCPVYRSIEARTVTSMLDVERNFGPRAYAVATGCSIPANLRAIFDVTADDYEGALVLHDADMVFGALDVARLLALLAAASERMESDLVMVGAVYPAGHDPSVQVGGAPLDDGVNFEADDAGGCFETTRLGFGFTATTAEAIRVVRGANPESLGEWGYDGTDANMETPDTVFCRQLREVGGHAFATHDLDGVAHLSRAALRSAATGVRLL